MYISSANSRLTGFKKWSDAHQPGNDDQPGGATPVAIAVPVPSAGDTAAEHRPWRVPGTGASL